MSKSEYDAHKALQETSRQLAAAYRHDQIQMYGWSQYMSRDCGYPYIHPNYDVMRLHNARVKAVRVLTGTEPNRVVGWLSFTGLGIVLFVLYAVFA